MDVGRHEDLRRLFELLKRVNMHELMVKQWVSHVRVKGEQMLKDEAIAKKNFKAVEDILTFKKKTEELVYKVFPFK